MDSTKRQRPYSGRACKKLEKVDPLELSPALWRTLPVDLAHKVLSFLPVDRLVDTLQKVLSHRNLEQLLQCHTFSQIFGHGKNLDSPYGFVTLSTPHKVHKMLRLSAFEHESMQWREFPKKGHPKLKYSEVIPGGSDGLLLCASRKSRINLLSYRRYHQDSVLYPNIGVWNPLIGSFKWLPEHPRFTTERSYCEFRTTQYTVMVDESYCKYTVMVDEPSRTYKVFLIYKNINVYYYSVYNSITGSWSSENLLPDFQNDIGKLSRTAACGRYVIFEGYDYRHNNVPGRRTDREEFICWYDSQTDSWDRAFLSEILADLDSTPNSSLEFAQVKSSAILHGILYMVITIRSNGGKVEHTLDSLDLSTLGHGFAPVFRFEALVPVTHLPMGEGRFGFHPPFNLYTYTMQGKGYVCVRTTASGEFLRFDVSSRSWLEHDKLPELGDRRWTDGEGCFPFKPSLVVP